MSFDIQNGVLIKYHEEVGVAQVVIPNDVTEIGISSFERCDSLKSVVIPDSVTSIGDRAFFGCRSLVTVTLPDSVTRLGDYVFYGCASLESVVLSYGITHINICAFLWCESLKSVYIPESVVSIEEWAFYGCHKLVDLKIPKSVVRIASYAFHYCRSLQTIDIPEGLTSLGDHAFSGCASIEGVVIPAGVGTIAEFAFSGCSSMRTAVISDGITSIGKDAFRETSLKNIVIPESVTSIGDSAFANIRGVDSLVVPRGLKITNDRPFGWPFYVKKATISGYTFELPFESNLDVMYVKQMLDSRKYNTRKFITLTYRIVVGVFFTDGQAEAEAYIKENFFAVMCCFINANDYGVVKKLFDCGKFVTEENIIKIAEYSIEHTQKGGDVQIQAYILGYRSKHFPQLNPLECI